MTTFELTPLFRATVGFDRLADLLAGATQIYETAASFPPYNIEKVGDNRFRITLAVAGFTEDDLDLTVKDNTLVVAGRSAAEEANGEYLYRGIAGRAFERRFVLADFVEVEGAYLDNGLLHIDLVREIPDSMKPRRIEITSGGGLKKLTKSIAKKVA